MQRETDAIARKQTFLLIRYVLILATGVLAFLQGGLEVSPVPLAALTGTALASNLALGWSPPFSFFDPTLQAPVLVADTAMVSGIMLLAGAQSEFFFFFFFVLIMAAKIENLVTLAIAAGLLGLASLLVPSAAGGWASPTLMRAPFLFACGVFFGYVVLPERTGEMRRQPPAPRRRPPSTDRTEHGMSREPAPPSVTRLS